MSPIDKEARPTAHPQAASSRKLFKGTLSPPRVQPAHKSYTLTPASISEVSIKDPADKQASSTVAALPSNLEMARFMIVYAHAPSRHTVRRPIAISSTAVPQPFVDPAVLQRRLPLS
ncbi:hypothetical protein F4678DRAFT_128097 [Xylaria arbuscula]|nr:hypothetical protein F4678DRAFT_128097 [Xylaria arbuscula]